MISSTAPSSGATARPGGHARPHVCAPRTTRWSVAAPRSRPLADFKTTVRDAVRPYGRLPTRPISPATMPASAASSAGARPGAAGGPGARARAVGARRHCTTDARIAADIAQSTVETVTDAEAVGRFEPVGGSGLFDVEYWSLEQAKLGQRQGAAARRTGRGRHRRRRRDRLCDGAERSRAPAPKWRCFDVDEACRRGGKAAKRSAALRLGLACDVTDAARQGPPSARRTATFGGRRYRRVECGCRLAGPDRRGRRRGTAAEL